MAASWSDLSADLLALILINLPCLVDRVYFTAVCRSWRYAEQQRPPPPQLPWLLLPSAADTHAFFSLLGGATRRLFLPPDARTARWCGSFDGGWLLCALHHSHGYALLNLRSRARITLPDRVWYRQTNSKCFMVLRAAALSASPTSAGCLAAAIISGPSNLAFWRPGAQWWSSAEITKENHVRARWARRLEVPEDLIYYKSELFEGFHVLTTAEEVFVCMPQGYRCGEIVVKAYSVEPRDDDFGDDWGEDFDLRYLVESRGKLLMVLRSCVKFWCMTWLVRVFEMAIELLLDGRHRASWVELKSLDGRILFVGRGCSRALEASQFRGLPDGRIYFMDDDPFEYTSVFAKDPQYSCYNMGMYSMEDLSIVCCFPNKSPSGCSPPMWCFP